MSDKKSESTEPIKAVPVTQTGSTFAQRAAFMEKLVAKQVDVESDVEDKAVARKKTASKKG